MITFEKRPNEVQDYDISFSSYLAAVGDTGGTIVVTSDPGITLVSSSITGAVVKLWMAGGVDNGVYKVTIKLTTTPGARVKEEDIVFRVRTN